MNDEAPWYLLLPLAASLLFVAGMMFVKKASQAGIGPWTVAFVANLWAAFLFSMLWPLGGAAVSWQRMWQPGIVAAMYVVGQICAFLAIQFGDVSVAAPVLSVKVLMVAVFLTIVGGEILPTQVWLAATVATIGVAMIQRSGGASRNGSAGMSVIFALLAATNFALFDVLVQRWAPAWGPGRFLPFVFGMAGVLSLAFLPWIDFGSLRSSRVRWPVLIGGFLIALQSVCIVLTVAMFGDAARVNIVYAMRGIWGVMLAWLFARWLGGGESHASRQVMATRLAGAAVVTGAVVLALATRAG